MEMSEGRDPPTLFDRSEPVSPQPRANESYRPRAVREISLLRPFTPLRADDRACTLRETGCSGHSRPAQDGGGGDGGRVARAREYTSRSGVLELCLTRCRGGAKDLRCIARSRH